MAPRHPQFWHCCHASGDGPKVTSGPPGLDPPAGTPVRGEKAHGRCRDGDAVWAFRPEVARDLVPEEGGQGYIVGLGWKPPRDLALVFFAEPHLGRQLGPPSSTLAARGRHGPRR